MERGKGKWNSVRGKGKAERGIGREERGKGKWNRERGKGRG